MKKDNTKNNPRGWSGKFWRKNNVSDILKEVIEPNAVDVSSLQLHDTLSNEIWVDEKLMPEVRKTLLLNAKEFIRFSDLEDLEFADIILTGSLANYNYSEYSDIDIHILLDFNQISENIDFVGEFLKLKKKLWSMKLPVTVKGFDVEIYYQNVEEPHHSTGMYSIYKDEWIRKPIKQIVNIDTVNVQLKSAYLMNQIDELEKLVSTDKFLDLYKKMTAKIKKYRQQGLESEGELSTENLVFKILRNNGYLNKLRVFKETHLTNKLSLESKSM